MSIKQIDTAPRRALCFTPMETDRSLIVEASIDAEGAGYEAVIVPEGWGFDSGVILTEIALRTSRIRLVAGVQSVWGRTPGQLAMQAATLAEVSGGRFVLGLGASTPQLASGLHGLAFERPAARLTDTLTAVRGLLTGKRAVAHDGRPGLRLGLRPTHEVPIWVAGLGPHSTALALEQADGWFPALLPTSEMKQIGDRASAATRGDLIVSIATAVHDDPGVATEIVRQLVGWYLVGMGRLYGDRAADAGFAREVAILRLDNPQPRPGGIVWSSDVDPLLDEFAVHGDAAAAAGQLQRWDERADLVAVLLPPGIGDLAFDIIRAAAPKTTTPVLG